jgi:hypothetical protein
MSETTEVWLRGPVDGVDRHLQPVAHALIQAREDVDRLAPGVPVGRLWHRPGAASAGFHLLHLAGALDRLFTYARGETLNDAQKAALRAESQDHPHLDGTALARVVSEGVDRALDQLRRTAPSTILDARRIGRAGLPSTVLGVLFHAAEHTTRHAGQFVTTVKIGGEIGAAG